MYIWTAKRLILRISVDTLININKKQINVGEHYGNELKEKKKVNVCL